MEPASGCFEFPAQLVPLQANWPLGISHWPLTIGHLPSPGEPLNPDNLPATTAKWVHCFVLLVHFSVEISGLPVVTVPRQAQASHPMRWVRARRESTAYGLLLHWGFLFILPFGFGAHFRSLLAPRDPLAFLFSSLCWYIPASGYQIPERLFFSAVHHSVIFPEVSIKNILKK